MIRDPKRIPKITKILEQSWKKHPELRLGQIIQIIEVTNKDAFYYEDKELIRLIQRILEEL